MLRRTSLVRLSPRLVLTSVAARLRRNNAAEKAKAERFPLLVAAKRSRSFDSSRDEGKQVTFSQVKEEEKPLVVERSPHPRHVGLYFQYFAVGCVYGGLPSTLYGFYLTYLNVPGYVYASALTSIALPWSLKFVFGAVNDCVPILGYRRKPYMVLGWCLAALALVLLAVTPLPEPYWCVAFDPDLGREAYVKTGKGGARPCNAAAADSSTPFTFLMALASFGYCMSDVAADGLTVTLARAEPLETRGATQTTVYLYRTLGNIAAVAVVGAGMNSWRFGGDFARGLSYSQIMGIFAAVAVAMVPISYALVQEPRQRSRAELLTLLKEARSTQDYSSSPLSYKATPNLSARLKRTVTFSEYAQSVWTLLRSRAMFYCVLYQFCTPALGVIFTTAAPEVKQNWARVRVLQNATFSLVGLVLFTVGLWLVKSRLLNHSWRHMILVTTIFLNLLDMPFSFLTIFDVFRSQYFFLGETVLSEIPAAVNFVVSTFVIVEMAEGGDEGILYGLLTTTGNLGYPVAQALSNQIFGLFKPALSNPRNYVEDEPSFRKVVAASYLLSYLFSFASLVTLPLLPSQKDEAQRRKREWGSRDAYAWWTIAIIFLGLAYAFLVNILVAFPGTSCHRFVGGGGCGVPGGGSEQVASFDGNDDDY